MQLVGMLDSPYVRRVAISLCMMGVPFEHRPLSVFRNVEEFRAVNPVVKAPTLICDDGTVLMDSTLILDYAEQLAAPGKRLTPAALPARQDDLRLIGLALAACEKTVQIVYERNLRPAEKQHEPWVERVRGQLLSAYGALEEELAKLSPALPDGRLTQGGLTTAVAWRFTRHMLPAILREEDHPALRAFSARAEALPDFIAAPLG